MSSIELIVAALSAGAAAGLTDTASAAVKDAYASLKSALRLRVRGQARQALEADEVEADVWVAKIGEELVDSGAGTDEEILALARQLLSLTDRGASGIYQVDVSQAKGVQVGDYNVQTNNF